MAIDDVKIIDSDGGYDIYNTMENIYEEITADKKIWQLRFIETYHLIKEINII